MNDALSPIVPSSVVAPSPPAARLPDLRQAAVAAAASVVAPVTPSSGPMPATGSAAPRTDLVNSSLPATGLPEEARPANGPGKGSGDEVSGTLGRPIGSSDGTHVQAVYRAGAANGPARDRGYVAGNGTIALRVVQAANGDAVRRFVQAGPEMQVFLPGDGNRVGAGARFEGGILVPAGRTASVELGAYTSATSADTQAGVGIRVIGSH